MVGDDSSRDRDVLRRAAAAIEGLPKRLSPRRLFAGEATEDVRWGRALSPLRVGDPIRGRALTGGVFSHGALSVQASLPAIFAREARDGFGAWLHGFDWLADVRAAGSDGATERDAVDAWIAAGEAHRGEGERILARRLLNWLACGDALFAGEGPGTSRRIESLLRQARRLEAVQDSALAPNERLEAAAALAALGVCFDGLDRRRDLGLEVLAREAERQILPDGGHISRSPMALLHAGCILAALDDALAKAGRDAPTPIRRALDRARPMLAFFRQPDGGLPAFHGGEAGDPADVAAFLAGGPPAKPFGVAPHSGYHRVAIGGCVLIVDVAAPAAAPDDAEAHASPLAMTYSTPTGRLFINCGWSAEQPAALRPLVRSTAAHSALCVDDAVATGLRGLDPAGRGAARGSGRAPALVISARRNEEDLGVWIEGAHEGYRARYGLAHRRRLFVAASGGDLRGEDIVFKPLDAGEGPNAAAPYAIRFHLSAAVRPVLARDGRSATLTLPSGECWRFRTDVGPLTLEASIDASSGSSPRETLQLVISGAARPDGAMDRAPNRVRWALQRLGRAPAA